MKKIKQIIKNLYPTIPQYDSAMWGIVVIFIFTEFLIGMMYVFLPHGKIVTIESIIGFVTVNLTILIVSAFQICTFFVHRKHKKESDQLEVT